jgi:UDP-N-acetylglucosamine--N-acetylmuramyl-(pentapeptide) pyrophosphoryl-undecaprenol N-acetylglucosamine transferase
VFSLLGSIINARAILRREKPDLVLGVGGYIMAPTVLAGYTLGIASVIHEFNVTPGKANRLCARYTNMILLTYDATRALITTKAEMITVGCPVAPKILTGDRTEALARYNFDDKQPVLAIVGGSLGAQALNALALAGARLTSRGWQLLWITGPRYIDEVNEDLGAAPDGVTVVGYEDRMDLAYAAADLVVARAGSSTLSELTAIGKPAILIPSPNVTDNHQEGNARGLEDVGAAWVLTEGDLDIPSALVMIGDRLNNRADLAKMAEASRGQGHLSVATDVAALIEERFGGQ